MIFVDLSRKDGKAKQGRSAVKAQIRNRLICPAPYGLLTVHVARLVPNAIPAKSLIYAPDTGKDS
jgi:hypothetical protein